MDQTATPISPTHVGASNTYTFTTSGTDRLQYTNERLDQVLNTWLHDEDGRRLRPTILSPLEMPSSGIRVDFDWNISLPRVTLTREELQLVSDLVTAYFAGEVSLPGQAKTTAASDDVRQVR